MKQLESYVSDIVMGLPITAIEKEDLRRELIEHLEEHINELVSEGIKKEEAIEQAIQSFGDKEKIHKDLQKALFPYYKIVRWLSSTVILTIVLLAFGNMFMNYVIPGSDYSSTYFELGYVMIMLFTVGFLVGLGEFIYEVILLEYKARWIYNPWLVILTPAIIIAAIVTTNVYVNIEQYPDRLDLITIGEMYIYPLSAIIYTVVRQFFTWCYDPKKTVRRLF